MPLSRRRFLQHAAAVSLAAGATPALAKSPNEKLNIACVGVGGRGASDLDGVRSQNIVAICDVDDRNLAKAGQKVPAARSYHDYRVMLDKQATEIDAVVVATPDHMHAPIAAAALRAGKHVYCEKPLAHDVHECRALADLARAHGVATQMGTQIHAGENYRRVVELVQSGAIGPVRDVHVWVGKSWANGRRPKSGQPAPKHLHWDLWIGSAPMRPYAPGVYHPSNWRRFWDFGTGTLGDMACHFADVAFWALKLRHPTTVAADGPEVHPEGTPHALVVRYAFPSRGEMPPCHLTWYDGGRRPRLVEEGKLVAGGKPQEWGSGVLFVGDDGMLLCDYSRRVLLPESRYEGFTPPDPWIPASIGHHNEWIQACKDGSATTCNFDYSGALSEAVLLGNVAFRTGQTLEWDAGTLRATNAPGAEAFLKREYREGWVL